MRKSILLVSLVCMLLVWALPGTAQKLEFPITDTKYVMIDSTTEDVYPYKFYGEYRGFQDLFFYEPETGNMLAAHYALYASGEIGGRRRIEAAISTDGGDTWNLHMDLNDGVPPFPEMNGRYPTVWGTAMTPIVWWYCEVHPDHPCVNVMTQDILGWDGGLWDSAIIDEEVDPDTVVDYWYGDVMTAPDDPNLWMTTAWHANDVVPGEQLVVYRSNDAGVTWSRPMVWLSSVEADSLKSNYIYNIMSSGSLIDMAPGGKVFVAGEGQEEGGIFRGIYATYDVGTNTWSDPAFLPDFDSRKSVDIKNDINRFGSRNKFSVVDKQGNWHLFQAVLDTSDAGIEERFIIDCIYDGSTWSIMEMARPEFFTNGFYPADEDYSGLNWYSNQIMDASIGPDGTVYFLYSDLVDTTGGEEPCNVYVKYSEDNGQTWMGPVTVMENYYQPVSYMYSSLAYFASDHLHIGMRVYDDDETSDSYNMDMLYYVGIPTAGLKATSVPTAKQVIPEEFDLEQNYPNPFNPTTTIEFALAKKTHVNISVFNSIGQKVETLVDKEMTAGKKAVVWYANDMPSGTYYYKMKAGDIVQTKEMVLVK